MLTKYRLLGRAVFSENQLKVAANYFTRYGSIMVFVGRLIPVVRTLISFPAGAVKMPIAKFVAYTVAGCLVWNSILLYVGYYLGSKWREVADVLPLHSNRRRRSRSSAVHSVSCLEKKEK